MGLFVFHKYILLPYVCIADYLETISEYKTSQCFVICGGESHPIVKVLGIACYADLCLHNLLAEGSCREIRVSFTDYYRLYVYTTDLTYPVIDFVDISSPQEIW